MDMNSDDKGVVWCVGLVVFGITVILTSIIWSVNLKPVMMAKLGYEQRVIKVAQLDMNHSLVQTEEIIWVKTGSTTAEKE